VRNRLIAVLLAFLPSAAAAQSEVPVQEALLRVKPAVVVVVTEVTAEVTVSCGNGPEVRVTPPPYRETGTGWFIAPSGWVLTNAHVVSAAQQLPKGLLASHAAQGVRQACLPGILQQRGLRPGERPEVEDQIAGQLVVSVLPRAKTRLEPSVSIILANGFRLPAKIAKYSPPMAGEAMSGRNLALLRAEASDMPSLMLSDSTKANIGDRLHIIGFPNVVATHELLSASAKMEASVTSGAISGFKQDVANQPVIQTDAAAAAGASGSPAVNDAGRVIGTLSFVTSDQGTVVQGFNFIEPASAIGTFLKDTGVPLDEPSRFNAAWHAGLRDYFTGRYSSATRHFAEANRLLPELPDVRRIEADARERTKTQPLLPWATVGAIMIVVGAGGFLTLLGLRYRRNRYRIRPSEVARMSETANPPVILDVRETTAYARSPVRIPKSLHLPLDDLEQHAPTLPIDPHRIVVAYCT
jgi:S1-C subfamily serine protease